MTVDERGERGGRNTAAKNKAAADKLKLDMQIAKLLVAGVPLNSIAKRLGVSAQQIDAVAELLK